MSLTYLNEAVKIGDREKLIRYVRLHFGDGSEDAGRKETDKAWVEALKLLLHVPDTNRELSSKRSANNRPKHWRIYIFACIFISSPAPVNGYTMDESNQNKTAQLRPVCGRRWGFAIPAR